MAIESNAGKGWNNYIDIEPKKVRGAYVEVPTGEMIGPLKVVGPVKIVHDQTGAVVETQVRGYGPDSPPQGSGWIVVKGILGGSGKDSLRIW